jgi:Trk K+ transport system NAD-binding subunit
MALIEKLNAYKRSYVVIVDDYERSKELYDKNVAIAVGPLDDPATYLKMQIHTCALLVATSRDELNTNIAFTVRELNEQVPIIATANSPHSVDILQMAGCTKVIELPEILGRSLAGWVLGGNWQANTLARLENLLIVETPAASTPLVGKSLAESRLREQLGVTVVGVWERGTFELATGATMINRSTVLILAGTQAQIDKYDEVYSFYQITRHAGDPVLIFGAGRVGDAIAKSLREQDVAFVVIDKNPRRILADNYILGDAADLQTLQKAGLEKAPAVLITTHDDATNIYLAKYLRSLRPGLQIISRANLDRNISTLYRAGADFVMSYASLGANTIFNYLMNHDTFMLAEGLNIFRLEVPRSLVGKTLAESNIRQTTGCTVIGIARDGAIAINPDPRLPLQENTELIMTGNHEAELLFFRTFR